jgi:DNA helicase-2/ATP-dependent DNA helicase PcrA
MTRAETRLFLTSAARRRIYGVEQSHPPSLFLVDIPSVCIQDYSAQPVLTMSRQPWSAAPPEALPIQPRTASAAVRSAVAPVYAVGTQVFHQHFGRGVVQKREGDGEQLKLTVLFREHGVKKLLARFAPLQPLS